MVRQALVLTLSLLLGATATARGTGTLLTPADVEKATGLSGVRLAPKPLPGLGPGGFEFVVANNTPVLAIIFMDAAAFEQGKKPIVSIVGGTKITTDLFHAAVAGVGDDAYDGPNEKLPYIVYVRVGSRAFSLETFFNLTFENREHLPKDMRVQPAQMRDLAMVLVARLRQGQ